METTEQAELSLQLPIILLLPACDPWSLALPHSDIRVFASWTIIALHHLRNPLFDTPVSLVAQSCARHAMSWNGETASFTQLKQIMFTWAD
jgi:hypothetical protein